MKKVAALFGVALALAVALHGNASAALTVSLFDPGNSGIGAFSWSQTGNTIDLYENWTQSKRGFLLFDGVDGSTVYTVVKHIYNSTGTDWNLFSNELLDPDNGVGSNDDFDPKPYPGFVPAGFTTSNDLDGLSFAQGYGIPKTSTSFSTVFVDELTDARDFIEFNDGSVSGLGGYEEQSFGLTDTGGNQPFLLAQRPNEHSVVPEPGTLMLLGSGLVSLGFFRRKK